METKSPASQSAITATVTGDSVDGYALKIGGVLHSFDLSALRFIGGGDENNPQPPAADENFIVAETARAITLLSEAEREYVLAEADLAHWRAIFGQSQSNALPQWKVEQIVHAEPAYIRHKTEIARAKKNVAFLNQYVALLARMAELCPTVAVAFGQQRK